MSNELLNHPDIVAQIDGSPDMKNSAEHFVRNGDEYVLVTQRSDWEGGQILFVRQGSGFKIALADTVARLQDLDRTISLSNITALTCKASSQQDHDKVAAEIVAQVDKFSTATGPDGGNLACVWAVRHIAKQALGRWITRTDGTAVFYPELRACMGSSLASADVPAGGIVISPTVSGPSGRNVGHVGLLGPVTANAGQRLIYSNSSAKAMWKQNFTVESWLERYAEKKKLKVYFYKLPHSG